MKKTIITLLAGATLLLSSSCGNLLSGDWNINNAEGLAELKKGLLEENGEKEIYTFEITAKDHVTSEFGNIQIKFLEEGTNYSQSFDTENKWAEKTKASDAFQKEFFLKKMQGKLKVKDIDFNLIATKFNEACALIPTEYGNFNLYSWKYEVDNDNKITADFKIEGTEKGKETEVSGRNIITNYYEFPFSMNEEGEISFDD